MQVLWRASIDAAQDVVDIYNRTTAILFLGTPHRGTEWHRTASTIEYIVRAAGFDTNPKNLKALSIDSGELNIVHENFMRLLNRRDRHFEVRTFQETQGISRFRYLGLNSKVSKYAIRRF
jgi:hypothetical protein